ncbi:DUF4291 family protein [Dactylosporangium sp. NPDC048998]|uniref:DUF4291 family protein n=1 Tax=Dactylosporangium sp. NPDC048998 TaxID=3363976 RepID=UPI00371C412E
MTRQIRAVHSAETITVYQAYGPQIALPALKAGRFTGDLDAARALLPAEREY